MGEAKRRKLASAHLAALPESRHITLPQRVLEQVGRDFPDVWKFTDHVRTKPEDLLVAWPGYRWESWCFLPVNVINGLVARLRGDRTGDLADTQHAARLLAAVAAWRMTKGVYTFDPAVLAALLDSEAEDELPEELLLQLPEWCPYVATPGFEFLPGLRLHGFFSHVDDRRWPARPHPPELNLELIFDPHASEPKFALMEAATNAQMRAQLDGSGDIVAQASALARQREYLHMHVSLPLGRGTFRNAVRSLAEAETFSATMADVDPATQALVTDQYATGAARLASLLLYLVSDKADIPGGVSDMRNRVLANESRGLRNYQAPTIQPWDVGFRIGAQIRAAQAQRAESEAPGEGTSPCPHIRRAHWHTFWNGPLSRPEERIKKLRWLPPIPVNVRDVEDLVPTVHQVRREQPGQGSTPRPAP